MVTGIDMASRNFFHDVYDFFGQGSFTETQVDNAPFRVVDTSSAGTPTYVYVDGSAAGELAVDLASTSEIENVCIYQGDILQYDIDNLKEVEFRVKMNQATMDTASQFAFGLTGDRNDAIDSIAQAAIFRVIGADSTTAVVVETDDGTVNNDDVATGKTLINAYKNFTINFATGKSDVRFYVDGEPVATATTFDMSNYAGSLQIFMQIQKTADTNVDGFTVDRISVRGIR